MKLRIIIMIVALVLGGAWLAFSPVKRDAKNPVFRGRKLSAWLDDLHNRGLEWRMVLPEVRERSEAATAAFQKMGPAVLPSLMAIMREPVTNAPAERDGPSRQMQAAAAIALFGTRARATIPELIELMKRGHEEGWPEATALTGIGLDALVPVAQALTNSDQHLHRGAAEALGGLCWRNYGERVLTNAVPALTTALLHEPDVEIRRSVAEIMDSVRINEILPALLESLSDPDAMVRSSVIGALQYVRYEDSSSDLFLMITALKKVRDHDPDNNVRTHALRTIQALEKRMPKKVEHE